MQLTLSLPTVGACLSWYQFLDKRGVPAAIIKAGNRFAVHRGGKIRRITTGSTGRRNLLDIPEIDAPVTPIGEPFQIMRACNGYTRDERRNDGTERIA